nr:MAG TPA: hypothetical protein [Caudoviricetes sp.]
MDRLERLTIKARELKEPHLKPWERAIKENMYAGKGASDLLELLGLPRDDWRQIAQALTCNAAELWKGGG